MQRWNSPRSHRQLSFRGAKAMRNLQFCSGERHPPTPADWG